VIQFVQDDPSEQIFQHLSETGANNMNVKKIAMIVATLCLLSACNTMQGFGQDMKNAGQSIENSAAKHTGN
jgi:entericidin A